MGETSKTLTTKTQEQNDLDLQDEYREKIKNLQPFDLNYFIAYLHDDASQKCLVF